jgi:hypothetical protein
MGKKREQFQRPCRQRVGAVVQSYVVFDGCNIYDPRRPQAGASSTTAWVGTKENQ